MELYIAILVVIPAVLVALLLSASGVAAVTRGWVLPGNRRPVHRPRLYGWGQLAGAFALWWQMVFWLVLNDPDTLDPNIREWGTLAGGALLLTGLTLMALSYRTGGNRQGNGTP
ncbi:hypothetical protein [Streptomyces sp. NPDC048496]|uniref:hypothetical protein n=1 Tax=Streptomyces sp. NPDC048496 TaxID=3365558 RepID=UPI003714DF3F